MDTPQIGDPEWIALLDAKVKTLKNSRPLTPEEKNQLVYVCKSRNLDPLLGHIHLMFYQQGDGGSTVTFQTSVEALRLTAARTGLYAGSDEPKFAYSKDGKLLSATCTVYRMVQGQRCPFTATAYLSEYMPNERVAKYTLWPRMPHVMLGKVCEVASLRKAFPEECNGLYALEEMHQAAPDPRPDDPRTTDPKFTILAEALKKANVKGATFSLYLQSEYGQNQFSKLPEESQAIALDALTEGMVALWATGLTESVLALAQAKGLTPAMLAERCQERYGEPALGKLTHGQRIDLAEALTNGSVAPPPPEHPKAEERLFRGPVLKIEGTANVRCLVVQHEGKERYCYFRMDKLPAGLPKEAEWPHLVKTVVEARCDLIDKPSAPGTKMLVLRALTGTPTPTEPDDDIPDTKEGFRTDQQTPTERPGTTPIVERVQAKVFSATPPDAEHPRPLLMLTHGNKSEQVTMSSAYTYENALGLVNATVLFDLEATTPYRTVTRVELVTAPPALSPKNGASPQHRETMEKRLTERKLHDSLRMLAQRAAIPETALNDYCNAEYALDFDDLPTAMCADLREKLSSGAVGKWVAEVNALFETPTEAHP